MLRSLRNAPNSLVGRDSRSYKYYRLTPKSSVGVGMGVMIYLVVLIHIG